MDDRAFVCHLIFRRVRLLLLSLMWAALHPLSDRNFLEIMVHFRVVVVVGGGGVAVAYTTEDNPRGGAEVGCYWVCLHCVKMAVNAYV